MMDIYKNNSSARAIINGQLARSMKPLNKYNESMHRNTEEMTEEPNDRTGYDCGMEMELLTDINNHN